MQSPDVRRPDQQVLDHDQMQDNMQEHSNNSDNEMDDDYSDMYAEESAHSDIVLASKSINFQDLPLSQPLASRKFFFYIPFSFSAF